MAINYHAVPEKEIFNNLKTTLNGLSLEEVKKRQEKFGENLIHKESKKSILKIFLEQFHSVLIYILLASTILMFVVESYLDAYAILAILLLNGFIGFFQQYKAEKALENLKKLMTHYSHVVRDGKIHKIPSTELVPGDILIIEEGFKIPADCRIIDGSNVQTNEASLTGESLPVDKFSKVLKDDTPISERTNMLFAGTQVVRGSSKAVVINIGMQTEFGKIAKTLQEIEQEKTPMQKNIDKFSTQLGFFILISVAVLLFLGVQEGVDLLEMFLISVTLAISAIPEGLPVVLAIAFSIASIMLSRKNVIIRRLPAVESLGSVTVICTDKTGTLTEEKMQIQKYFANDKFFSKIKNKLLYKNHEIKISPRDELYQLIKTSLLCNNAKFEIEGKKVEYHGDPTEISLVAAALDLGINKKILTEAEPVVKKIEFDSKRKLMSVIRTNGRANTIYTKGAPEKLLAICDAELVEGKISKLSEKRREEILENLAEMEKHALRVLGFAYRSTSIKSIPQEKGLIFIGLAGMIDPPRPEVVDAISKCKSAGIHVKMITGDSLVTAKTIAMKIGIEGKAIGEAQLEKMSDTELLQQIDSIGVFARMTPHQKLRIANILQQQGESVAMTGDGVNDVLALKAADVGIAMGVRGTDVARDVSDMVLLDDNFASIVQGVEHGRVVYNNIKKFTKYMLSVNLNGILVIAFSLAMSTLIGPQWILPLIPLQILWINLITDSLPSITLVFEKGEEVMQSKPRRESSILSKTIPFILIAGIIAFMSTMTAYFYGVLNNFSPEHTRALVMTTVVLFELVFVYACRSDKSIFKIGVFSNKWLNYSVLVSLLLHLALLYSPINSIFGILPLNFYDWLLVIPLGFIGLFLFEIFKVLKFPIFDGNSPSKKSKHL